MKTLFAAVSVALLSAGCATTYTANWNETAATAASPTDEAKAMAAAGDELWAQRTDKAKLIDALAKWEGAAEKMADAELFTKISRGHYLLGDGYYFLEGNTDGRDAEYQKGLDWATKALKLAAPEFTKAMVEGKKHAESITLAPKEAVPAMYWYATNLGKWAATKGFTTRLKYKDDVKATIEHVKSLDAGYFYSAPWRYLASYEAQTAGLAGGSLDKSEEFFKRAVELAPSYLGTKVLWADYLTTKRRDRDTFEKLLKEVIAADPKIEPAIEAENLIEIEKAKKLLAAVDDKF